MRKTVNALVGASLVLGMGAGACSPEMPPPYSNGCAPLEQKGPSGRIMEAMAKLVRQCYDQTPVEDKTTYQVAGFEAIRIREKLKSGGEVWLYEASRAPLSAPPDEYTKNAVTIDVSTYTSQSTGTVSELIGSRRGLSTPETSITVLADKAEQAETTHKMLRWEGPKLPGEPLITAGAELTEEVPSVSIQYSEPSLGTLTLPSGVNPTNPELVHCVQSEIIDQAMGRLAINPATQPLPASTPPELTVNCDTA